MKMTGYMGAITGAVLAVGLWAATPATAEMINYKAQLAPTSEVPPTDSKGLGALAATFDTATKTLSWNVTYSGLTGPASMAHFHGPAAVGVNAGIVVPITGTLDSPIKGQAVLTDAQAADLVAGKWYFNIHTAANKGGEIRGQVVK
jgi:hypothetical protein